MVVVVVVTNGGDGVSVVRRSFRMLLVVVVVVVVLVSPVTVWVVMTLRMTLVEWNGVIVILSSSCDGGCNSYLLFDSFSNFH